MSRKIADLYRMTDAEVIAEHDAAAASTNVGTDYWMTELERRWREKSDRTNAKLARASLLLAGVSVAVAVVALIVTR